MINFEVQIRLVYFAKDQMHSKKTLDLFFWPIHGKKHVKCLHSFTQGNNDIY
jgi:hypothetical protein